MNLKKHLVGIFGLIVLLIGGIGSAQILQQSSLDSRGQAKEFDLGKRAGMLSSSRSNSNPNLSTPVSNGNPFGVMFADERKVPIAHILGVSYYRPISIFIDTWNGKCQECQTAVSQGLKLILTVRNNGGKGQPTTPPTNIDTYKKILGEIIDTYHPIVLVVENEENSQEIFYDGTPQQYQKELKAGCEVAHSKGVKCANGGLVSSLVVLLVTDDYLKKGAIDQANTYLQKSLGQKLEQRYGGGNVTATKVLRDPKVSKELSDGKALVMGYKQSGADFINFHWYVSDPQTMDPAVFYLRQASGLNVMINEVGQQGNTSATQVTGVMQRIVDLKIPFAVWFSVDISAASEARSLVNTNGGLRPNGEAFRNFIDNMYK